MTTIFTKIINRELPSYILEEDQEHIAFLDVNPLKLGHTLVVPKKEIDYIFNLKEEDYLKLHSFAKKIAHRLKIIIDCRRIGIAVVGFEVPHTHIHLIPLEEINDINFSKPKLLLSKEEFQKVVNLYQNK
jgi:histidine triad (HIT) family protein